MNFTALVDYDSGLHHVTGDTQDRCQGWTKTFSDTHFIHTDVGLILGLL